jgi:hypothetical protein
MYTDAQMFGENRVDRWDAGMTTPKHLQLFKPVTVNVSAAKRTDASRPLSAVGLFAGIGGLEIGLEASGHEAKLLCEIDPLERSPGGTGPTWHWATHHEIQRLVDRASHQVIHRYAHGPNFRISTKHVAALQHVEDDTPARHLRVMVAS